MPKYMFEVEEEIECHGGSVKGCPFFKMEYEYTFVNGREVRCLSPHCGKLKPHRKLKTGRLPRPNWCPLKEVNENE